MRPKDISRLAQAGDEIDEVMGRLEDLIYSLTDEEDEEAVGEIVGFLQDARYKVNDILPEPA